MIRVGEGAYEMTNYLMREKGVQNPRSRLLGAVAVVDPGTAIYVQVGRAFTILPWSVVESVAWDVDGP